MPTKKKPNARNRGIPWSPEEIELCLELYQTRTAAETARELLARGASPYLRAEGSLRSIVAANTGAADRLVELVRDYAGLPLCYRDLEDELGISRKHVQTIARPLVATGVLELVVGERGEFLLRDPIAWREAAA